MHKSIMMRNHVLCLILGCLLFAPVAQATMPSSLLSRYQVYKLNEDSELFREIEDVTEEIILRTGFSETCEMMWSPEVTYEMTGLSAERANSLFQSCRAFEGKNRYVGTVPKLLRRTYFVANDPQGTSPVQSWTSDKNETVIFVDPGFDRKRLRHALAHELAISIDAKMNMMYTTYLMFGMTPAERKGKLIIGDDNPQLKNLFSMALYRPFSYTFSAMRALSAEQRSMGTGEPVAIANHAVCADTFKKIHGTFANDPDIIKPSFDNISDLLARDNTALVQKMGIEKAIAQILNRDIKLKSDGRTVSFCQYMATPLYSPVWTYSLFASGPRPKITGGWGLERPEDKRDPRNSRNLYDSVKRDMQNKKAIQTNQKK